MAAENLQKTEAQAAYWKKCFQRLELCRTASKVKQRHMNIQKCFINMNIKWILPLRESLSKFTNQYDVTLASVMYTLWGVLLSKYANQDDIVFWDNSIREKCRCPHIEKMTGLFINTLPLRVSFEQERPT
ncbi:condensation domain-containing protein [Bacillus sp. SL00103]